MSKIIKIGIIGAGLMGHRRARAIREVGGARLAAVTDVDQKRAYEFAREFDCEQVADPRSLMGREDIDAVVVSVVNKFSVPIAVEALKQGKHVLCEKPLGRSAKEAKIAYFAARKYRKILQVGFNHRFHAAIMRARKIFDEGGIGKLMFIRARYGHGGRIGMEKEWRFRKDVSGGGELLDQGIHIIDLARWFGGEPDEVYGLVQNKFWKTKVEDNAFVTMKNKKVTTFFNVSATNWKNIFSFELFGTKGFLEINGKGGSYGEETLVYGKRRPQFGVPEIKIFKFGEDTSWIEEWKNFLAAARGKSKPLCGARDGVLANRIVEAIYRSSGDERVIRL